MEFQYLIFQDLLVPDQSTKEEGGEGGVGKSGAHGFARLCAFGSAPNPAATAYL